MSQISIVTYTYNRELFLPRTIESVLSQSFQDFDYIIVNNGSTDSTRVLLEQYSIRDKRVSIITRPVNDVSMEFFKLYKSIVLNNKARYYMQIDDDDYMEHTTVGTLIDLISENNADISVIGSKWVYSDGSIENKYVFDGTYIFSRTEAVEELLKRKMFNSAQGGKLYRKSLLENVELPIVEHYRDIHREYRVINNISKMVVSGTPLYYFSRHNSNVSGLDSPGQITPEKMRQHMEANTMRTEWLTEHMPEIKDFVLYCELSFMISLYERIYRLDVKSCFHIAQEMKNTLADYSCFLVQNEFCTEREKEILRLIVFNQG